ncbi:hypothetical protein QBC40DRAFT_259016 [Triangularia verruculosa]|uniref:Uncharacterized protein n=1 Tax=Triangularia verruculosa TaxID=2587418 RepID=A0AAN6X7T5_9PEZI|nr:hypothetical protein QBC40DRAFT_259016 [Triangularia verruculosa]
MPSSSVNRDKRPPMRGISSRQSEYPSPAQVVAAAKAVAYCLGSEQPHALVGGAACLVLGSSRVTVDVDLVVPKGKTKDARQLLRSQPDYFTVEGRTNHTSYRSTPPVEIEILTPPALFKEPFDEATETIQVNGTRVLKPTLILNAKCRSILGRANEEKKNTDAEDIKFLLNWCLRNASYPTNSEVPNTTKEFVDNFIAYYEGAELWHKAGYDMSRGMRSLSLPLSDLNLTVDRNLDAPLNEMDVFGPQERGLTSMMMEVTPQE